VLVADPEAFVAAFAEHLSPRGVFISTLTPPEKGRTVRLTISDSLGTLLFEAQGTVAWARGEGGDPAPGFGIRFTEVSPEAREVIDRTWGQGNGTPPAVPPTVTITDEAAERAEAERVAAERAEAERLEVERIEAERIEAARVAKLATERMEADKIAAGLKAYAERRAAEKAAAEKAEAERAEAEGVAAAERVEAERVAAAKIEAERVAAEQAERMAAEWAETSRMAEAIEAERAAAEREVERLAAERAAKAAAERDAHAEHAAASKAAAEHAAERAESVRAAIERAERMEAERRAAAEAPPPDAIPPLFEDLEGSLDEILPESLRSEPAEEDLSSEPPLPRAASPAPQSPSRSIAPNVPAPRRVERESLPPGSDPAPPPATPPPRAPSAPHRAPPPAEPPRYVPPRMPSATARSVLAVPRDETVPMVEAPAPPKPLERPATPSMKRDSALIIGIDLGTTFSCAAVVRNGKVEVVPTASGHRTIPSVVSIIGSSIHVGWPAYEKLATHSEQTIYGVKRLLGRRFDSEAVQDALHYYGCEIVPDDDGDAAVKIGGKVYSTAWISAQILGAMKLWASSYVNEEITKAVISVPAYYTDRQRMAVIEAGKMAGLDVKQIVNEPTAASVAYGVDKKLNQVVMVYDFGGGTFDVSVLEVRGNLFDVLATGGDAYLGGVDIDNRIVDWCLFELHKATGLDLSEDDTAKLRIRDAADAAKKDLSLQKETRIYIPHIVSGGQPVALDLKLTREILNHIAEDLVDHSLAICDETLKAAHRSRADISEVVLVGGQTRMPLVQGKLHSFAGRPARKGVHPDEAVAVGAALLADGLSKPQRLELRDVVSMTIGVGLPGGRFKPVVAKNSKLPAEKSTSIITTRDDQTVVHFDIFQGEADSTEGNEYLGTAEIADVPARPKGEVKVEIHFRVDTQGFLTVSMTDNASSRTRVVTMTTRDTPDTVRAAMKTKQRRVTSASTEKPSVEAVPPGRSIGGFLKKLFGRK